MYTTAIAGVGYCLPTRVVTNIDIEQIIDTSDDFITKRTGVKTRRFVNQDQSVSDLMIPAAKLAIAQANLSPTDIEMVIVNTLSPDFHDPSQACLILPSLGLTNIPAFDIRAQCSGLLYMIYIAKNFIESGAMNHILLICGEVLSKRMDTSNEGRNLSILLGDGAGAVILSKSDSKRGFIDISVSADGHYFDLLMTKAPGTKNMTFIDEENLQNKDHFFRLRGKPMFDHAVETMAQSVLAILEKNQLTLTDIDFVIPHQPNLRILEAIQTRLEIPDEKMIKTVDTLGNMASASLPIALGLALENKQIQPGMRLLFVTYGSGATWGSALYQN